jgi:hypothetical protein
MYKGKNGAKTYTLKEKIAYHNAIVNEGVKDGKKLSPSERMRHAILAKKATDKLQTFMAYSEADRDRIARGERPKGKPTF